VFWTSTVYSNLITESILGYPSEYCLNIQSCHIDNNRICINTHLFRVIIAVYPENRQKNIITGQAAGRDSVTAVRPSSNQAERKRKREQEK